MPETQTSSRREAQHVSDNGVVTRSVLIGGFVLAGIFILVHFLEDNLASFFGKLADEVATGMRLLALWLVVASVVRSVSRLVKGASVFRLLLAGVFTAAAGAALFAAFLAVFPRASKPADSLEVAGAGGGMVLLLSAIGLVVSLVAVVNLRVKSRGLGNFLELLIIGGSILLFLFLAKN